MLKVLYKLFFITVPTMWWCFVSGFKYQSTMRLRGRLSENSQHPRGTCLDSLSPLVMT